MRAQRKRSALLLAIAVGLASISPLVAAAGDLPAPAVAVPTSVASPSSSTDWRSSASIRGRVVNLSLDGVGVTSATVSAEAVEEGDGSRIPLPSAAITAATGLDGAFRLAGLVPDAPYRLVATYRGVTFAHSVAVRAGATVTESGVTLVVFEPDPEVPLDVRTAHIALVPIPEDAVVRVAEVWVVRNQTARVWVPSARRMAVQLDLPAGSIFLGAAAGGRGLPCQDGTVVDTMPLAPGERQATVSYLLPYSGPELTIERRLPWPTAEMRLLVAWPGVVIESQALTQTEQLEASGKTISVALGRDLPAGATVVGVIDGLPRPFRAASSSLAPAIGQAELTGLALGIGLVASAMALSYGWRHRAMPAVESATGDGARRDADRLES